MLSNKIPECPICYQKYSQATNNQQTPKLLSCGHSLCSECCDGLPQKQIPRVGTKAVDCPQCRHPTQIDPKKGFPTNFTLIEFISAIYSSSPESKTSSSFLSGAQAFGGPSTAKPMFGVDSSCADCELARAEAHCANCEASFCESCWKLNHASKILVKHQKVLIQDARKYAQFRCTEHMQPFAKFCSQCSQFVCAECCKTKHKLHKVDPLEEIANYYRAMITQKRAQVTRLEEEGKKCLGKIDKAAEDLEYSADKCLEELQAGFTILREALDAQERKAVEQVNAFQRENENRLNWQREDLSSTLGTLASAQRLVSSVASQDSIVELVSSAVSSIKEINEGISRASGLLDSFQLDGKSSIPLKLNVKALLGQISTVVDMSGLRDEPLPFLAKIRRFSQRHVEVKDPEEEDSDVIPRGSLTPPRGLRPSRLLPTFANFPPSEPPPRSRFEDTPGASPAQVFEAPDVSARPPESLLDRRSRRARILSDEDLDLPPPRRSSAGYAPITVRRRSVDLFGDADEIDAQDVLHRPVPAPAPAPALGNPPRHQRSLFDDDDDEVLSFGVPPVVAHQQRRHLFGDDDAPVMSQPIPPEPTRFVSRPSQPAQPINWQSHRLQ